MTDDEDRKAGYWDAMELAYQHEEGLLRLEKAQRSWRRQFLAWLSR